MLWETCPEKGRPARPGGSEHLELHGAFSHQLARAWEQSSLERFVSVLRGTRGLALSFAGWVDEPLELPDQGLKSPRVRTEPVVPAALYTLEMSYFNVYWLYDLPNWLFGVLVVVFFSIYGLIGLFTTRRWVRQQHREDHSHNDIVSYFLAAITVFYGITLGLLAVATWTNYSNTQDKVDHEAQVVASFYRDVNSFPEPLRTSLDNDLRSYVQEVVNVSWPLMRKGIIPYGSGPKLEQIQADLLLFEPKTEREKIVTAQAYQVFNVLVEARRSRLESVTSGMPTSLWSLVLLGALITMTATLFFDAPSFRMHFWMTLLLSTLLGLMVFLIGTLDNPFRGKVSIGPGSMQRVYDQIMMQHVSAADGALSRHAVGVDRTK